VVLLLKALHVEDILTFDFLDRPPQAALVRALEHLYLLGALTDKGTLAQVGKAHKMLSWNASMRMDPSEASHLSTLFVRSQFNLVSVFSACSPLALRWRRSRWSRCIPRYPSVYQRHDTRASNTIVALTIH